MPAKYLPIGIQNFRDFKERQYQYVDKTALIFKLTQESQYYFLSRPRRFGKSLLLSTLAELFAGSRTLFEGLAIEPKWNWSEQHPVIHLSFASLDYLEVGLEVALNHLLDQHAARYDITLTALSFKSRFQQLLQLLSLQSGKIVLLIDEYDKPIIDFVERDDLALARANQQILKSFFSVLKDASPQLRFVFITGVSKLTKVSVFSDLNHLNDITLAPDYATLTGYTQQELIDNFGAYIADSARFHQMSVDELLEKLRIWYNGYSWDGSNRVYNPFGTLNFFNQKDFSNYWFGSGTPTMLVELMKRRNKFDFEQSVTSSSLLDQYSLDNLDLTSLLFQTGYLTITERDFSTGRILLDYPNKEVRDSMYSFLLDALSAHSSSQYAGVAMLDLKKAFEQNQLDMVRRIMEDLFTGLPYDFFEKNIPASERFFHGMIHILFKYLGVYIDSEVHTQQDRADSVVQTPTHVYIFEFKYNQSATVAVQQIIAKHYAAKYQQTAKSVIGIGVNFDHSSRNISDWQTITIQ